MGPAYRVRLRIAVSDEASSRSSNLLKPSESVRNIAFALYQFLRPLLIPIVALGCVRAATGITQVFASWCPSRRLEGICLLLFESVPVH